MKDKQICVQIEQLAVILTAEIASEVECERNCRLQDAKEHLRRAWHAVDESPCEFNDLLNSPPESQSHIDKAADLIAFLGTTSAERGSVILAAEEWLKANRSRHLIS